MFEGQLVTRNSQGLVDTLFNSIDELNAKQITPEHARALSHTARTIVGVARLEMDYRALADKPKLKSLEMDGDTRHSAKSKE
jgi:hypothetical protein